MPPSAPRWVLFAAATLALSACQNPPPEQNAALLSGLHPAAACAASLPPFGRFVAGDIPGGTIYIPPDARITMANDGGWCTISFNFAVAGEIPVVPPLRVTRPPEHGEAAVGSVGQDLRIAYRPTPGFVGADHFVVHMAGPEPWRIPVQVAVTP
jgi:hypothetical protein